MNATEGLVYAAYPRVSDDEQNKGNSPERQLERIQQWAEQQGMKLGQYHADDGQKYPCIFQEDYTGTEYERPEMDRIRQLAEQGVINAVVVSHTDRFARDEAVFLLLERFFKKHNIRLFSVEEGEFTPGTVNRFVAAIQRAKAEDDIATIKKRTTEARRTYLRSGIVQSQGKAHYGYTKVGRRKETHYEIVPEQAEVINLIFDMYVNQRIPAATIAHKLNEMGYPGPAGAKSVKARYKVAGTNGWAHISIRRILRNSVYVGRLVVHKWETIDGVDRQREAEEHVVVPVPPIIDEEIWERAQHLNEHSAHVVAKRQQRRERYLLGGLIDCSCGYSLGGATSNKPDEPQYKYYRCASRGEFHKRCRVRSVRAADLEAAVWGFVERLLTDTRATVAKYRESQAEIEQQLASARAHLIAVDELGAEYKTQRGQILKQHQMRLIDDEELEVKIMEINRYLDGLQVERHRWENFISQKAITDQQIAELERLGQEITGSSGAATWEKKRAYLEKLRLTGVAERLDDGRLVVHITIFTHTWRVPVGSSDNGETPDNEKSPYASELRQDNHIAPSKSSRILSTSTCWSS